MKEDIAIPIMTVIPTLMLSRLRLSRNRNMRVVRRTMMRWMQRAAGRVDRFINEPSLVVETEWDPPSRCLLLYTHADSVTDRAPEFLRRAEVRPGPLQVPFLADVHIKEEVNG